MIPVLKLQETVLSTNSVLHIHLLLPLAVFILIHIMLRMLHVSVDWLTD